MPDYERMESLQAMGFDPMMETIDERERRLYGDEPIENRQPSPLINWSALWRSFFPKKEGAPL